MSPPTRELASSRAAAVPLRLVNAAELLTGVGTLSGARASGGDGNGIASSRLLNRIEYAHARHAPEAKLRATWKHRQRGGAAPLVLVADDPDREGLVLVLGPQKDGPLRRIRADAMLGVVKRTVPLKRIHAIRLVAEEVERLAAERVAGQQPDSPALTSASPTSRRPPASRPARLSRASVMRCARRSTRSSRTPMG